jgi:hypothetical protein
MEFHSVLDKSPQKGVRYIAWTEEGYCWLLRYNPPHNAVLGNPLSWFDDEHDTGYVIAWAEIDCRNPDWERHYERWKYARDVPAK